MAIEIGQPAPAFDLPDPAGERVKLAVRDGPVERDDGRDVRALLRVALQAVDDGLGAHAAARG